MNDPASEVSYLTNTMPTQTLRPEEGTKPHVFYIGADRSHTEYGRSVYNTLDVMKEDREVFDRNHNLHNI